MALHILARVDLDDLTLKTRDGEKYYAYEFLGIKKPDGDLGGYIHLKSMKHDGEYAVYEIGDPSFIPSIKGLLKEQQTIVKNELAGLVDSPDAVGMMRNNLFEIKRPEGETPEDRERTAGSSDEFEKMVEDIAASSPIATRPFREGVISERAAGPALEP